MSMKYDFTYLAFGGGKQSTALLICSALGLHGVPRVDVAIFADTGDEPNWVYENVERMISWGGEHGLPVHIVSVGTPLSTKVLEAQTLPNRNSFRFIPAYTTGKDGKPAILNRQCTKHYKIIPIQRLVRQLLGYKPRQHVKHSVRVFTGISLDESWRMKPNPTPWITTEWPLVEARLRTSDCLAIIQGQGLPLPHKSACVYCPFHSTVFWRDLQRREPESWKKAVEVDRLIRDMTAMGMRNPIFVHKSMKPLGEIDFQQQAAFPGFDQDDFLNECEGTCGL